MNTKGSTVKWFTSDLHHEHRRIVEFTNRGVETTQGNHTDWLRDKWNSQVSKGDLVYHLGDFSFAKKYLDIARFVDSLHGQKIFIKGNHDQSENLDMLKKDGLIISWHHYKEIKIGKESVVLFHFPISSWHKQGHGSWHLHGHCHGNLIDQFKVGKILDVGIDNSWNTSGQTQHHFYNEDDVRAIMERKNSFTTDHHKNYKEEN
jgi:calcineurin-like phosphoesterase family protein